MKKTVLARLEGEALDQLVHLAINHLLSTPIGTLIDPMFLAKQTVVVFHQSANSPQTEEWIRKQVALLRKRIPSGTLKETVPQEIVIPIRSLVSRPFAPDKQLVSRLLEHRAVEELLRELLVGALQSFAKRIKPSIPGGSSSRLKSFKRVREGVLGGLGQEIERQAEQRVKEFVDGILTSVIAQTVDDLCDPGKGDTYGRFRVHILDQILDTPIQELQREIEKLDPEELVSTALAITKALAERENLETEIADIIQLGLLEFQDKTAATLLKEAGIMDTWRAEMEAQIAGTARDFVQTPGFDKWLSDLLTP
jgi:hypothetical protein